MLYRVREFVNTKVLKLIYHAIFGLSFKLCKYSSKQRFTKFPIITERSPQNYQFSMQKCLFKLFFYRHKILKLPDKIIIENCLFISKSISFDLPSVFNHWFTFSSDSYRSKTSCSSKAFLKVNIANTKQYGREALIVLYHHGMIFKNIFYLIKCYVIFPLSN